jgi:hypothetical protein
MGCENHALQVVRTGLITSKGVLSAPVSNNHHRGEKKKTLIRVIDVRSYTKRLPPLKQASSGPGQSMYLLLFKGQTLMSSRVSLFSVKLSLDFGAVKIYTG